MATDRLQGVLSASQPIMDEMIDTPVGRIPRYKEGSFRDGRGGGGGQPAAPADFRVGAELLGYEGYDAAPVAPPSDESWKWGDVPVTLASGVNSALGTMGDIAGFGGYAMTRGAQNLISAFDPSYDANSMSAQQAAVGGALARGGRAIADFGERGAQYWGERKSDELKQTQAGEFLDNPSFTRVAFAGIESLPSMAAPLGAGIRAGKAAYAGARALGATEKAAGAAAARAGTVAGGAVAAPMEGSDQSREVYSRIMSDPGYLDRVPPEVRDEALRIAGGNRLAAQELIARRARDQTFATVAALSFGSNLALGAGAGSLWRGGAATGVAGSLIGRELPQEAIESGGGYALGGFAENMQGDPNAQYGWTAFSRGVEGGLVGALMDAPSRPRAIRDALTGARATSGSTPDAEAQTDVLNTPAAAPAPRASGLPRGGAFDLQTSAMSGWDQLAAQQETDALEQGRYDQWLQERAQQSQRGVPMEESAGMVPLWGGQSAPAAPAQAAPASAPAPAAPREQFVPMGLQGPQGDMFQHPYPPAPPVGTPASALPASPLSAPAEQQPSGLFPITPGQTDWVNQQGQQDAAAAYQRSQLAPGTVVDMFGGRPRPGPGAPAPAGGPVPDLRTGSPVMPGSPRETAPGQTDWVAEQQTERPRSSAGMRAPAEDMADIDAIRTLAISMRRRAKNATSEDARARALAMADQLDQQADDASKMLRDQYAARTGVDKAPLSLPRPETDAELRTKEKDLRGKLKEAKQPARLPESFRIGGTAVLRNWVGKTASELNDIAKAAEQAGDEKAMKRAQAARDHVRGMDAERAQQRRALEDQLKTARPINRPAPEPKPRAPRSLRRVSLLEEPTTPPPAAVEAAPVEQTPVEQTPVEQTPAPASVEHSVYDPMLNASGDAEFRGERGWLYRVADPAEVQDIRDSGQVRSRPGVDNGKGNRKYWTRGVGTNGKTLRVTPGGGKVWIRIPEDAVAQGVTAADVQILDGAQFAPLIEEAPAAPAPAPASAPASAPTAPKTLKRAAPANAGLKHISADEYRSMRYRWGWTEDRIRAEDAKRAANLTKRNEKAPAQPRPAPAQPKPAPAKAAATEEDRMVDAMAQRYNFNPEELTAADVLQFTLDARMSKWITADDVVKIRSMMKDAAHTPRTVVAELGRMIDESTPDDTPPAGGKGLTKGERSQRRKTIKAAAGKAEPGGAVNADIRRQIDARKIDASLAEHVDVLPGEGASLRAKVDTKDISVTALVPVPWPTVMESDGRPVAENGVLLQPIPDGRKIVRVDRMAAPLNTAKDVGLNTVYPMANLMTGGPTPYMMLHDGNMERFFVAGFVNINGRSHIVMSELRPQDIENGATPMGEAIGRLNDATASLLAGEKLEPGVYHLGRAPQSGKDRLVLAQNVQRAVTKGESVRNLPPEDRAAPKAEESGKRGSYDLRYSRRADEPVDQPRPRITLDQLRKVADDVAGFLKLDAKNVANVVLAESPGEISQKLGIDIEADAEGVYHEGKVYLFASNLSSPRRAAVVYMHEVAGHSGLRQMFGPELNDRLMALRNNSRIVGLMDMARRQKGRESLTDAVLIEEIVADLAAEYSGDSLFTDTILGGIASFVRNRLKTNVLGSWAEAAEVRYILAGARRSLRGGKGLAWANALASTANSFAKLAQSPEVFQYHLPTKTRGTEVVPFHKVWDDMIMASPDSRAVQWEIRRNSKLGRHGFFANAMVPVTLPNGTVREMPYLVDFKPVSADDVLTYEVTINAGPAADARPAQFGAQVYQALHHYARLNGLRIVGDDAALSEVNELRRTDAMLSAFLRAGGETQFSVPSKWQFVGMLPQQTRDLLVQLRRENPQYREINSADGAAGLGFGAGTLTALNDIPESKRTAKQKEHLKFLTNVSRELENIRTRMWKTVPAGPYRSVEDAAKVDTYNTGNMSVLLDMFRSRLQMDVPVADRLFVTPNGDIALLDQSVAPGAPIKGRRLANLNDAQSLANMMRTLNIDPAATGVGMGTLVRYALINSMYRSSLAKNGADAGGLGRFADQWADPATLQKLERGYVAATGNKLLYSRGEETQDYRDALSGVLNGARTVAIAAADRAAPWAAGGFRALANPRVVNSMEGRGFLPWLVSSLSMRNVNLMSRANLGTIAAQTKLFFDAEADVDRFVVLDRHVRRKQSIVEEQVNSVHDVLSGYENISRTVREALGKLMVEATINEVDPMRAWEDQKHLHGGMSEVKMRQVYDKLVRQLNELDSQSVSPKETFTDAEINALQDGAKKVYLQTRALFEKQRQATIDAMVALNKDDADTKRIIAHMKKGIAGPYFPLRRYGEYFVVATRTEGGKEVDRYVEAFETEEERNDAVLSMRRMEEFAGWDVSPRDRSQHVDETNPLPTEIRNQIKEMIKGAVDSGQLKKSSANALLVGLEDIYVANLPGMPAAKAWLRRRGVKGASTDMKRATADAGFANAIRLADLQTAREIADATEKMRMHAVMLAKKAQTLEEMQRSSDAMAMVQHLEKIEEMEAKDVSKFSRLLSQIGPLWYLVTPSFWLMQPLQMFTMTVPKLAAKLTGDQNVAAGWRLAASETAAALSQVYPKVWEQFKEPGRSIASRFETKDKTKAWLSLKEEPFAQMAAKVARTDNERLMLEALNQRNLITVTMAFDVMNVAQQGNATWLKTVKAFMWPAQNLELANRLATGLAAYRIATQQHGMAHEQAMEYAAEVVSETQVDYSEANRPLLLSSKFLGNFSPLAMFQMYRQNMLWNVTHYGMQALKGDKEAKRFFMGMMLTHGLMAGVKGLPLIGGLMWLASILVDAAGDDDDPEYNPWEEMRLGLSEFVGEGMAEVLLYGAPRGVGVDTHGRLGINGLWASEYVEMGLGRDAAASMLASALGVPGTMFMDLSEAAKQVSEGDYYRAGLTVAPKGLKDPVKGVQYMTTGLTTRQGYVAVDPSLWNGLVQFTGFTPADHANYYTAREVEKAITEDMKAKRSEVIEDAYEAVSDGDSEAAQEARDRAKAIGLSPKDLRRGILAKQKEEGLYRSSKLGLTKKEREVMGRYFTPYDIEKEE